MAALRIAIVGAESTGKTTLAQALAARLREEFALDAVAVPEALRQWCADRGRTPRRDEQHGICLLQQQWIDDAARSAEVVLCDTTPLMIAIYSQIVFGDDSLVSMARALHASNAFTLLTALDIAWVPDGLQRDGPHVRAPVDQAIRTQLLACARDWAVVTGEGQARTANALAALRPVLAAWCDRPGAPPGIFSRLLVDGGSPAEAGAATCERCDQPHLGS
ncbi:MAG: AAA family ATPase [Vitreoscilla sp.]